ncbi:MAG: type II secretion system F family protein [Candidatus Cloacimonetes bacterium]|nr:type II secretion system F family protein [Candidatus Cloacimonadota bacterium]
MLKEFRYKGIKKDTKKMVRGTIFENNLSSARKRITQLSLDHGFALQTVEQKKNFLYKARTQQGKLVKGEQESFTKAELIGALESVGYKNIRVQVSLINIQVKPPFEDIVMFISITADMLKENLKFDEILKIHTTDVQNKTLRTAVKGISRDLRQGQDGMIVFQKYADVFGTFTSYMLGLASKSGNMAEIYESTAIYLVRQMEFKKNVRQALVMPIVTFIAIAGAIGYYVGKLFPEITEMFVRFKIPLPPMTAATLQLSYFLQAHWWWMILMVVLPIGFFLWWFTTPRGMLWRDTNIYKLPLMGPLIHKMNIEIFFRVFSIIYTGSGNNIEVLQVAAEACGNAYMEKQIKDITIPRMLKEGAGLIESIEAAGVFTDTVVSRLNAGSATGSIKSAAYQIATYYEKETGYKFKAILQFIDVATALIILVTMTALIVVSSESAFMRPPPPGM